VRPQQCRGHNHLGRSPERPGHLGQPAATGHRRALQHCTVRSAPRPLNNVLPPWTPDVKRRLQPCALNTTHATSGQRHDGLNLSVDMASVKQRTCTHARGRLATRPPAAMQAAAHRHRTTPKPHATHRNPLRRRPDGRRLYRFR